MIICVGGQKGGTGKSTAAVCLAAWLAGQGKDVLLIDANSAQALRLIGLKGAPLTKHCRKSPASRKAAIFMRPFEICRAGMMT